MTRPESFTDEMFLELVRMSFQYYYKTQREQLDRFAFGGNKVILEETGHYMCPEQDPQTKKWTMKKVEVPGLKLLKRGSPSNSTPTNPRAPQLPPQDMYISPSVAGSTPELWPILVDADPANPGGR